MRGKQLQDMNLLDDFLFNALISNAEYGEPFARCLLETILGRPLKKVTVHAQQVVYPSFPNEHGIRMDAYIEEECAELSGGVIYDLEPDSRETDKSELPKRARYYHVLNDSKLLKSGDSYTFLRQAFVIFITPYDPFGRGLMVYTVRNICIEDPEIPYDDGAVTLFLYTRGEGTDDTDAIAKLLRYFEQTTEQNAVDENLKKIQKMVDSVKNSREAKRADMKFHELLEWERGEARKEGRAEGLAEGRAEESNNTKRERMRADAAEEEVRRLRKQLAELTGSFRSDDGLNQKQKA